jgi:cobaltochelatase CobS
MIKSEVDTYKLPFTIEGEVTPEDLEPLPELTHMYVPKLVKAIKSGVNVMLVGEAGGGKTTACEQVAKHLKLPFHFNGMLDGAHEIKGYPEIDGSYNETPSYLAFKNGGVYLKDEMDADHAEVTVAFNMMLANDKFRFAQGYEHKHKDFVAIAACNTYGKGADRQYVGRNQLDAATLDRFVIIDWDYDENLERTIARNDEWVSTVQELRRGVERAKVRHIISPRASIEGAKLLRNGFSKDEVLDMVVWKGLPKEQQQKVKKG